MVDQLSPFNRILLGLLVILYLVSLGMFTYINWRADQQTIGWSALVNALILSMPLILFYGSIYVLVIAWREHHATGLFSPRVAKTIHWVPRIAAAVIIFFITLFSLDVFDMGGTILEQIGAFLIHSIPSIVMVTLLVFAWRRPMVGFVAFLIAGIFFLRTFITGVNLGNFLLFSGPLLLIAAMFYFDWRWNITAPQPPADIAASG